MLKKYDSNGEEVKRDTVTESITIEENEKPESVKLGSAIERIKYLEEEVNDMKAKVKSLERAVETKDELIDQFKGRNNMLKIERIGKDSKLSKYNGVCAKMTKEIKKLTEVINQR